MNDPQQNTVISKVDQKIDQHFAYIGLGSNLDGDWGDREAILQQAVQAIAALGEIKVSKLYASPPMGPQDQPDYLNAVVKLATDLAPLDLLDVLQNIEQQSGRVRLRHWGERTLDLDLLLYDHIEMQHPRLNIPHVGLRERDFVILPLFDVLSQSEIEYWQLQNLACLEYPTAKSIVDQTWCTI